MHNPGCTNAVKDGVAMRKAAKVNGVAFYTLQDYLTS